MRPWYSSLRSYTIQVNRKQEKEDIPPANFLKPQTTTLKGHLESMAQTCGQLLAAEPIAIATEQQGLGTLRGSAES